MNLKILLFIHAVITFAAGVVLMIAPYAIPETVGVHVEPDAYLVCYLLGAAEFAIAFLSFAARTLHDVKALRIVAWTFIVFHACTAAAEIYAQTRGLSSTIYANVALRVLVIGLFAYYGLRQTPISRVIS